MNNDIELLKPCIRSVTNEDKQKLETFSYSKLEVFKNCPMQYKIKYKDGLKTDETTLALELGSLCHKILELKGQMLVSGLKVNYEYLRSVLEQGYVSDSETLLGIKTLRTKYFDDWLTSDNKSGMNYDQKIQIFNRIIESEMEDSYMQGWQPYKFEHEFEFVWKDRAIIHGFIDRIDQSTSGSGEVRVWDYKTSKAIYDNSKVATSMQFFIYALAILHEVHELPTSSNYRFILIDRFQPALSTGYVKRGIKALDNLLDKINNSEQCFCPNPTPLCYWCDYCKNNPQAKTYRDLCPYYSLWTPTNKTFSVNQTFDKDTINKQPTRKLIF